MGDAEGRLVGAVLTLLRRHAVHIGAAADLTAARNCLVIARAMVEATATTVRKPPADLRARVVRALLGYLGADPAADRGPVRRAARRV